MFWRTGCVGCERICGGRRRRSEPEASREANGQGRSDWRASTAVEVTTKTALAGLARLEAALPLDWAKPKTRDDDERAAGDRNNTLSCSCLVSKRKNFVSRARTTLLRSVVFLVLGPDARAHVVTLFPENSIRKDNFVLHLDVFKCILYYSNKEILYF